MQAEIVAVNGVREISFTSVNHSNKTTGYSAPQPEVLPEQIPGRSPISDEELAKAVEKANKILSGVPKKIEYSVHEAFGDIVIKVLNAETNEVITEFPPEKILDIVANLVQLHGAIIDEKR